METRAQRGLTLVPVAATLRPAFSYAFQPIVDAASGTIYSYEALIRGKHNEPAGNVFARVGPADAHGFDEDSRLVAIELAARLGIRSRLNVNCLPRSLEASDRPLRSIIDTAARCGLPVDRIILEVTENELIEDQARFALVVNRYRGMGLKVAIDDFGAGHSGLNLLADFQPDMVKLDMKLVRGIDSHGPRQAVVRAILQACNDLGIDFLAEGVETPGEYFWLRAEGVELFQGYLLGEPAFERLPGFVCPVA